MGKITVKHYLEKRIKPTNCAGNLYYPVYIQVTISRKTTQIKSITGIKMTECEFEKYRNNKNYNGDFYDRGVRTKEYFEKEPERIKKAFEFMINTTYAGREIDKSNINTMMSYLDLYLFWTNTGLLELCWNYQMMQDGKYGIYQPFNKEITLSKSIDYIKRNFGVDLKDKIPRDDYIFWHNIRILLLKLGSNSVLIDFISNYKEIINKIKQIEDKDKFITQIEEIINNNIYAL